MAEMTSAAIDDLPDSDFAYIEAGGKVVDGKTEPRSLRHFPIHDAAHVRAALSRLSQSPFGDKARAKVEAAAKRMGIGGEGKASMAAMHAASGADVLSDLYELLACEVDEPDQGPLLEQAAELVGRWIDLERQEIGQPDDADEMMPMDVGKSFFDMKAEDLTKRKINQWLGGEIGRRLLVVPFSGPLPGGKAGLDLDGEYFDEVTDLYGNYPALKASNWRLMDWHHDDAGVPAKQNGGPAISMKSVVIGEIELDDDPDEFGHWAQWWIRQGRANEQKIGAARVAALQEMGQPVWGSSMAIYKQKASDGHIEVWPLYRHTASTSPRNNHAVIPPLKALLTDLSDEISPASIKAAVLGLDAQTIKLLLGSRDAAVNASALVGPSGGKAGRVLSSQTIADLERVIALAERELPALIRAIRGWPTTEQELVS